MEHAASASQGSSLSGKVQEIIEVLDNRKRIPLLFYFSYFMLCELKVFLSCPVLQGGKLKWVSEDFVYKYILIGL